MPRNHKDAPVPGFTQWKSGFGGSYFPQASTVPKIPAGAYEIEHGMDGPYLKALTSEGDDLIQLPDPASEVVLRGIQKFWTPEVETAYTDMGLVYKRGIILYGPQGSGKSSLIQLLSRQLITQDGVVIFASDPGQLTELLTALRVIEPKRYLIIILEDLDNIIAYHGDRALTDLLDGAHQTHGIVYIATTNNPERLPARVVNRPARFDMRVEIGLPSADARLKYLIHITKLRLGPATLTKWVKDTDGFSVAHLRDLAASTLALQQPYEEVLARLRAMAEKPHEIAGFAKVVGADADEDYD